MIPLFSSYNIDDKYCRNSIALIFFAWSTKWCKFISVFNMISLYIYSQIWKYIDIFSYNSSTIVVINLTQPRIRKRTFHVASRICMYALNQIPLWVRVIQSSQKAVSLFVIGCSCNERRGLFLLFEVESCASRLLSAVHTATLQ